MKIIALGQEKGGVGKTTMSVWLADALRDKDQQTVRVMDLDSPQSALAKFYDRRRKANERLAADERDMWVPHVVPYRPSKHPTAMGRNKENFEAVKRAVRAAKEDYCDYFILDCGGNAEEKTKLGLSFAHTILSPMPAEPMSLNTYLHGWDPEDPYAEVKPGSFTKIVRSIRTARHSAGSEIDWIVALNKRPVDAEDRDRHIEELIRSTGRKQDFTHQTIPGCCLRKIYSVGYRFGLTAFSAPDPEIYRKFGIYADLNEMDAACAEISAIADAILHPTQERAVA